MSKVDGSQMSMMEYAYACVEEGEQERRDEQASKRDKAWLRYVALLTNEYAAHLSLSVAHGYKTPEKLFKLGEKLRKEIGITPEEVDAEIDKMKEEEDYK